MHFWSIAVIRLGLVLVATGFGPLLLVVLFPSVDALIPIFLAATLGPLGALVLLSGIAIWFLARHRQQ